MEQNRRPAQPARQHTSGPAWGAGATGAQPPPANIFDQLIHNPWVQGGAAVLAAGVVGLVAADAYSKRTLTSEEMLTDLDKFDAGSLHKLMANPENAKTLDKLVEKMDDKTSKKVLEAAMQARFGVVMKDFDTSTKAADVAEGKKSIKETYLLMLKVPESHVRDNPSLTEIDRKHGVGSAYGSDKIALQAFWSGEAANPNPVGDPAELPNVDADCKPQGTDTPPYLSWTTLHEVGHAVDDKESFMSSKGNAYAGWQTHSIEEVVAVAVKHLQYEITYIRALLTGAGKAPAVAPPPPKGTDAEKVGKTAHGRHRLVRRRA